jgi:hypothetical protein
MLDSEQKVEIRRLRRQRNLFAGLAVLSLMIALGSSLPRRLRNYWELKKLNAEVVWLQGVVVTRQDQIREVQAQIIRAQDEIKVLEKR